MTYLKFTETGGDGCFFSCKTKSLSKKFFSESLRNKIFKVKVKRKREKVRFSVSEADGYPCRPLQLYKNTY